MSDFLPFNKLLSDGITIRCYNGSLARVFRVEGVDLAFVTDEKVMSMLEARKSWIDGMSDLQVTCRVITLRERIPLEEETGDFGNKLLSDIASTWRSNLDRVYSNQHYIVLSVADRTDSLKDLNYASQALIATLSEYGVTTCMNLREARQKTARFRYIPKFAARYPSRCRKSTVPKVRI